VIGNPRAAVPVPTWSRRAGAYDAGRVGHAEGTCPPYNNSIPRALAAFATPMSTETVSMDQAATPLRLNKRAGSPCSGTSGRTRSDQFPPRSPRRQRGRGAGGTVPNNLTSDAMARTYPLSGGLRRTVIGTLSQPSAIFGKACQVETRAPGPHDRRGRACGHQAAAVDRREGHLFQALPLAHHHAPQLRLALVREPMCYKITVWIPECRDRISDVHLRCVRRHH